MKNYTLLLAFIFLLLFHITTYGQFASVWNLTPIAARVDATKEKQQAKVFVNAGRHWAIIANSSGTHLWRLDGTTWTSILKLSTRNARADCIVDGNTTHIFLYAGKNSELVSVEYVAATNKYQPWSKRINKVDLTLDDGVETGAITRDGTGRMWLVSDATNAINVRYSDGPYYTSWSGPYTVASGVKDDDIGAIINMPGSTPGSGKIGVLWSNQNAKKFGFKTHSNSSSPTSGWSSDEVPAGSFALNVGAGMADDHLNMKIGSNGTIYAAVKTGYDKPGYPVLLLLVRRPTGVWDRPYEVAQIGTRPMAVVNELKNKIRVVYTSLNNGGDILYKESTLSSIAFGTQYTLISGINNNVTSTHQNFTSEIAILASNTTQMVGVLASDAPGSPPGVQAEMTKNPEIGATSTEQELLAYPNPFTAAATLSFALPADGEYSLTLYDSKRVEVVYQKQGVAKAGELNTLEVSGVDLVPGMYFARLQANGTNQTLRMILNP